MDVIAHQWFLRGVLASLEEPKEHVGSRVQANIAGIIIDTWGGFAHPGLARLLVPNLGTLGRSNRRDASGVSRHLTLLDERCASAAKRRSRQDGSNLGEARHGTKACRTEEMTKASTTACPVDKPAPSVYIPILVRS